MSRLIDFRDDTVDNDDLPYEQVTLENSEERWWVHKDGDCRGETCAIHKRTDHSMRSFPQHFRSDRALMERVCSHGAGHPDPDDLSFHEAEGREEMGVHGCCGCCVPEPEEGAVPTSEQWVGMFLRASTSERLKMAEIVLANAEVARRCIFTDHDNRITYLSVRVNDLVAENLRLIDRYAGVQIP